MKNVTDLEIIEEIYNRQDEIISNISRESIDVYLWLGDEYKKGSVKDNAVFQFVFRSYYRLDNAGLGEELKRRYFELLDGKENNLESILNKLYEVTTEKGANTVQFSFATKLLHTIDNSKPIFDTEVSAIIHEAVIGNSREAKTESAKIIYAYMEDLYPKLINNEKIQKVIEKFKSKFNISTKRITEQKMLDFLIWSLGKLKKKK